MLKIDIPSLLASATETFSFEVLKLSGDLLFYHYVDFLKTKLHTTSSSDVIDLQCDIDLIALDLDNGAGGVVHGCYLAQIQLVNCLVFLKNQALQLNEDEIFTPQDDEIGVDSDLKTWFDGLHQFCNCLTNLTLLFPNIQLDIYHVLSHSKAMFSGVVSNEIYEQVIRRFFPSFIPICHCLNFSDLNGDLNIAKNFYTALSLTLNLKEHFPLPRFLQLMRDNLHDLIIPLMRSVTTNTSKKCAELNLRLQNDQEYKRLILEDDGSNSYLTDYNSLNEILNLNQSVVPCEHNSSNLEPSISDCIVVDEIMESEHNSIVIKNSNSQPMSLRKVLRTDTGTVCEILPVAGINAKTSGMSKNIYTEAIEEVDSTAIHESEHGDANEQLTQDLPQLSLGILLNDSLLNSPHRNISKESSNCASKLSNLSSTTVYNEEFSDEKLLGVPSKESNSSQLYGTSVDSIDVLSQLSPVTLLDKLVLKTPLRVTPGADKNHKNVSSEQINLPKAGKSPKSHKFDNLSTSEETTIEKHTGKVSLHLHETDNVTEDLPQLSLGILFENSSLDNSERVSKVNGKLLPNVDKSEDLKTKNISPVILEHRNESNNIFNEDNGISTHVIQKQVNVNGQQIQCVENKTCGATSSIGYPKPKMRKLYKPTDTLILSVPVEDQDLKTRYKLIKPRRDNTKKNMLPSSSKIGIIENSLTSIEETSAPDKEIHSSQNKSGIIGNRNVEKSYSSTFALNQKCPMSRKRFIKIEVNRLSVPEIKPSLKLKPFDIRLKRLPNSQFNRYKIWHPMPLVEIDNILTANKVVENHLEETPNSMILGDVYTNAKNVETNTNHSLLPNTVNTGVDNLSGIVSNKQCNSACKNNTLQVQVLNIENNVKNQVGLISNLSPNLNYLEKSFVEVHLEDKEFLSDDTLPIEDRSYSISDSDTNLSDDYGNLNKIEKATRNLRSINIGTPLENRIPTLHTIPSTSMACPETTIDTDGLGKRITKNKSLIKSSRAKSVAANDILPLNERLSSSSVSDSNSCLQKCKLDYVEHKLNKDIKAKRKLEFNNSEMPCKNPPSNSHTAPSRSTTHPERAGNSEIDGESKWITKDNYLSKNSSVNGVAKRVPWSEEEEEKLVLGVRQFGTGKWFDIAKHYDINKSSQQLYDKWRNLQKGSNILKVKLRLKRKNLKT